PRQQLAESLSLAGDFPAAERVLREGLTRCPGERFALPLARMYERWAEAVVLANDAPSAHSNRLFLESARLVERYAPDSTANQAQLYSLYQRAGQSDEAMTHLMRAIKELPDLRLELAWLYAMRGDSSKATEVAGPVRDDFRARLAKEPAN